MTCETEDNTVATLLQLITNGEDERFKEALSLLVNTAMLIERQQHLRAAPYQRTEEPRNVTARQTASRIRASRPVWESCRCRCLKCAVASNRSTRGAWRRDCAPSVL